MSRYLDDMCQDFVRLASDCSQEAFDALVGHLEVRDSGTFDKHIIPYLASRALLAKGDIGLKTLVELFRKIDGYIYPMAILETIWQAGRGRFATPLFISSDQVANLQPQLTPTLVTAAQDAFIAFVSEARESPEAFDRLIGFLYHQNLKSAGIEKDYREFHQSIFQILSDSAVRLSQNLLDQFESLLLTAHKEEELQQFLAANPVLLDPLASRTISKHKLGNDLVTDYVLETLTGEYIVVEIEKPSDPLLTKGGDFAAPLSHAFGQVIEFIDWIERNVAYAQTKLPGISTPRGLVVIGRLQGLSQREINKLRRLSRNSSSIEIVTFDDLLDRAKALYRNIRHRIGFTNT